MQKVIVILGPTAAGKTAVSIALAKTLGGEIVSADSRQVYKGLDIGSGKVTKAEMRGIPHYLLDVADPKKPFSAAAYVKKARAAIKDIAARGKMPIVVGGTGFYIDALLGRVRFSHVPPNPILRARLKNLSTKRLLLKLARLDINRASTIDGKNRVRLIRAIEIATALGRVPELPPRPRYEALFIGIGLPDAELKKKIHDRLLTRMKEGMLEEVQHLHKKDLPFERMEELGLEYRYLARYLQGKLSYEDMLVELERAIQHYAKRQKTWFKRNKDIRWFAPEESRKIRALAKTFLQKD